ncbi:MAG: YeeE/YedE family protein [Pseudomonadota bacterium]
MQIIASLVAGLVFGLGLIISGMGNPAKVQNFLDLTGAWDPSLIFVMGGAIAVALPGFWLVGRRVRPLFADVFQMPTKRDIDGRLIGGSVLFGTGWGLGGYCPGPAMTAVPFFRSETILFVIAMLVGMWFARQFGVTGPITKQAASA